jgi:hypothetical protein
MGDATWRSPIPLQAPIIRPLGSYQSTKTLYENHSLAVYTLALLGTTISVSLSRAPLTPLEDQRTGFSIGIGPVLCPRVFLMYTTSTPISYIRNVIPDDMSIPTSALLALSGRGLRGVLAFPLLCGMEGIGAERGGMDARKRDDTYHRGRGSRYIGHSPTAGTLGACGT